MEVRDLFESMDYGAAPESADPAQEWLDRRKGILDHFIGGEWLTPASGEYFPSHNPASCLSVTPWKRSYPRANSNQ